MTDVKLIEKIVRAKMHLERARLVGHSPRCVVELDPDSYAPCSCGVAAYHTAIDAALRELKL